MSSRKNIIFPTPLFTNQSLASNANSLICNIQYMDTVAIQINLANASSLNGTFAIAGSNDYVPSGYNNDGPANAGNFIPITGISQTITSGSPANTLWNLANLGFAYIQIQWTNSSGTGTCSAYLTAKAY